MKTERTHRSDIERYHFDLGKCSVANGFAQVDTGQDASYFGTWANPTTCVIVQFTEGDIAIMSDMTPDEFAAELREMKRWTDELGSGFKGIDGAMNDDLISKFAEVGLADLLH